MYPTIRRCLSVLAALAVIGAPLGLLLVQGCEEDQPQQADAPFSSRDSGTRSCDMLPNQWTPQTLSAQAGSDAGDQLATLFGVWGASEFEVFAVGTEGKVVYFDGQQWTAQDTPTAATLTSVWGTAVNDVWAVGYSGTVIHYDGNKWTDMSPPDPIFLTTDGGVPSGDAGAGFSRTNLWGVWVTGNVDPATKLGKTTGLYAVGDEGLVIFYDGVLKSWVKDIPISAEGSPIQLKDQLNAVWGSGLSTVYAAGNFGTILKGSKDGFEKQQTGVIKNLNGIWGRGSTVFAVGNGGTLLQSSGAAWKEISGAPKQVLRGIWGPSNDPSILYIIGWDGTLLQMTRGTVPTFDPFYCIVPGHRLEGIWGTMVPAPTPDAGYEAGVAPDSGTAEVPAIWVVGASGMVITGP